MKAKRKSTVLRAVITFGIVAAISAYALVGEQISKSLSDTIDLKFDSTEPSVAEHVFVKYLRYYVPAQRRSSNTRTRLAL